MEAARAMAQGIENADHDAEVRCLPMADGGEGTARALVDATGGSMRAVPVHDPLGRPVEGHFGLLADGTTAVVETAEASGLALLEAKERNPLIASSPPSVPEPSASSSGSAAAPPTTPVPDFCRPSAFVFWTRTVTTWHTGERPSPI